MNGKLLHVALDKLSAEEKKCFIDMRGRLIHDSLAGILSGRLYLSGAPVPVTIMLLRAASQMRAYCGQSGACFYGIYACVESRKIV